MFLLIVFFLSFSVCLVVVTEHMEMLKELLRASKQDVVLHDDKRDIRGENLDHTTVNSHNIHLLFIDNTIQWPLKKTF